VRRFFSSSFLFALIALLLLRGWAGEAMATDMAAARLQPAQSAIKTIAGHAHGYWAEATFYHPSANVEAVDANHAGPLNHGVETMAGAGDCADHALTTSAQPAVGHCGFHAACQACSTLAPTAAVAQLMPVVSVLTRPDDTATRFASADAATRQKPPIS
jgi:hypothetical protein